MHFIVLTVAGLGNKIFTLFDDKVRHTTATISHIQLVIGVLLYFVSPVVDYFLHYFPSAIHERDIRFFGMEHSTMMFLAIVVITIGSSGAKRRQADKTKFKTIAITYTIGLLIIFFPFHGHFLVSPADHTFAASNDYCYFFTPCQLVSSAL